MPGRSTSGSTGFISFSGVESALSSLKNFQSCISSGMDAASSVALDLVETQTEVSSEYSMDKAMIEFAIMDRELNHYIKAVQSAINHVSLIFMFMYTHSLGYVWLQVTDLEI
ncbi:E3 SUMO-protein ligase NSE2 isoform X4 [Trichechus manatus latirostris]|nr:E3 SUMO-protein ligase NSE2 isoform X4 [Trichechus manatus latirostris]